MSNASSVAPEGAFGAFGAFSGSGAFGAFGAFGAPGPADPPLISQALITNHAGIASTWEPVTEASVLPNSGETTAYLSRLSVPVRASIFAFELGSRIGFGFEQPSTTSAHNWARVYHLETVAPPSATTVVPHPVPGTKYQHLIAMRRPTQEIFAKQLTLVANYADLRQDRMPEILAQLGTPTEFLRAIAYIEPARTPFTIELLATAHWLANFVEMRLKYALACKRPNEFSPQIQPMIWTPSHGSLPSGHATEAFTMARVLWALLRAHNVKPYSEGIWGEMLMRQAARIAINRTVAGVHFPVDSAAGAVLGLTLGNYFVERCTQIAPNTSWSFDGRHYPDTLDFDWRAYFDPKNPAVGHDPEQTVPPSDGQAAPYVRKTNITNPEQNLIRSRPLEWLWRMAAAEWADLAADTETAAVTGPGGVSGGGASQ